jgi:hypothetical protein
MAYGYKEQPAGRNGARPLRRPRGRLRLCQSHAFAGFARQADTALHLDDWANSRGLKPPK